MPRFLTIAVASLLTAATKADLAVTVDKLDASDGIPLPPSSVAVVDVFVDVTPGDYWTAGGLVGYTFGSGARLIYAVDPDSGLNRVSAPGTDHRFVSFVGFPSERNADGRFASANGVQIAGELCGTSPYPYLDADEVNVAYYLSPPPPPPPAVDGYVARVAVDLSGVVDPRFRFDSTDIVVTQAQPPGSTRLFETLGCGGAGYGTLEGSLHGAVGINFGVYGVPEPSGLGFLGVATLMHLRRR